MQKVQKKVWQLIDDDSAQYVSYLDPAAGTTGKVFDFAQVTALPDGYVISKEVVDVGAYTDADIEDTLKLFGYNDLDDFVDQNSPVVIRKLPDGTLDKECCISRVVFIKERILWNNRIQIPMVFGK